MPELDVLGLDNVLLAVGDFGRARDFYAGQVGLPVKFEFEQFGLIGFRRGRRNRAFWRELRTWASGRPRRTLRASGSRSPTPARRPRAFSSQGSSRSPNRARSTPAGSSNSPIPGANVFGLTDYVKQPERGRSR